uniref:ATG11 domain-containing protein n=1 Tax=Globodera pallida TaxID=36090 RepID=A0A183CLD8_GLOPA
MLVLEPPALGSVYDLQKCIAGSINVDINEQIVIPPSLLLPAHSSANLSDSEGSVEEITLFDWISSKDPAYSLTSFSQHVLEHLEKTTNEEYRDIRGIDKRLATLNAHLLKLEGSLAEVRETTAAIIQPIIQDGTQNVVVGQKNRLKELKGKLSEQRNCALSFINSKDEVIQNICQRLATWIRQAYQRLQDVDKRVMCFDQKFGGLRQRMDLARQITETPSIYMTAVPEVIRREALKKEFAEWMGLHIAKTSEFIAEENKIRQHFFGKLDRHFLRQLFPGMDDVIPQFSPKTTPKVDELLPKVHFSHLHELRSRFPEMKELLVVGAPNLVSRLAIFDPSLPSPMAILSSRSMRREESFYVRDKTSNIDVMNRNFPSTNWLSEESMGLSPSPSGASNFLTMEQRGSVFSTSSASIHSISGLELQSPQELGPLGVHFDAAVNTNETTNVGETKNNRSSMSPLQPSAPIAIPSSSQSNPVDPIESLGSNQFSTPDDTFGSLGSTCGGRFVNVKQAITTYRSTSPKVVRPKSMLRDQMCSQLVHKEEDEKHYADQEMEIQKEKSAQTNHEFHSKLAYALTGLKELSEEISSVRQNTEELGKAVVVCLSKPEIITSEEKCLQKIAEIERKCNSQIMGIANELQRERSLLIEKENAIKEQNEVVCRITNDLKVLTRERDQLLEKVKRDDEQRQQKNASAEMEETDTQPIDVVSSSAIEEISTKEPLVAPLSSNSGSDEDEGVAQLSTRSYGTQTKIRGKDMQTFISLNELYEGCGALIIWNSHFNAYVARSTSSPNSPYIVKDSSFEKLGIRRPPRPIQATDENSAVFSHSVSMPRPWMFVLVESIEMCQIRKATNRYNLPLDTRFYRISVLPILGDFVTAVPMSTTSSVSSSNARK